jgi:hypothetical protein
MLVKWLVGRLMTLVAGLGTLRVSVLLENYVLLAGGIFLCMLAVLLVMQTPGYQARVATPAEDG